MRTRLFIPILLSILITGCGKEVVKDQYQNAHKYLSPLEKKFAANGTYAVSHETHDSDEPRIGQYQVWYPHALITSDMRWPAVIVANGTGVKASRFEAIFRHMASWGFIVVGNEDPGSWDGMSSIISLQHLLDLDKDAKSLLQNKVDTTAIGLMGHSQGGIAVYNAATLYDLSHLFKAICPQSAAFKDSPNGMGWYYYPSQVAAPTLIMASTGPFDSGFLCPLSAMQKDYDSIVGQPVMMGRIRNIDHGDVLSRGEAYALAWMRYWLCGDSEAARCFCGEDAEMMTNTAWQDVKRKNI